jgi:hypothetical protein
VHSGAAPVSWLPHSDETRSLDLDLSLVRLASLIGNANALPNITPK